KEEQAHRFWVRDHGPDVPAEQRKLLFHPFHRLHELDSANGLGLSIVQRLVELQGGRCGYESAAGGGACFYFALPFQEPSEEAEIPGAEQQMPAVVSPPSCHPTSSPKTLGK